MEADWSVEIGAELPSIIVPWRDVESGVRFVDMRNEPEAIKETEEARNYPPLAAALLVLNGPESQVFTSKCDVWRVAADDPNALDMGVSVEDAQCGVAAYIDIVLREAVEFASFELHEEWMRRLTAELRALRLPAAGVELTLRWAEVEENEGFAITVHITACGADEASALRTWEEAVDAVAQLLSKGVAGRDVAVQPSAQRS